MSFEVVVVGASVRALAQSVIRAGGRPIPCDLFADGDLRRLAATEVIGREGYPEDFEPFLRRHAGIPWMYTGGLENAPKLLSRWAEISPLWGNTGEVVQEARSPERMVEFLRKEGLATLEVTRDPREIPADGSWMIKPIHGTGGMGVRPWWGESAEKKFEPLRQSASVTHYWQRRARGTPHSAIYVGREDGVDLVGVTRQRIGEAFLHAQPFRYAGSTGPIALLERQQGMLRAIGRCFGERMGLRGVFGVDFLLTEDGNVFPVEINPRYTASVEVLEWGLGVAVIELHRQVFSNLGCPSPIGRTPVPFVDKGILFARQSCRIRRSAPCYRDDGNDFGIQYADIPEPDSKFAAGDPILSLLAFGDSLDEVSRKLSQVVEHFYHDSLEPI
ncbi:MAG: ATP-grasp domain-containing protein [Planctomycetota bacterium]